jgi:membrane-associated protease RseP (regulator of RpoE activity)
MAENVANHLLGCLDGTRRMVVLAGGNHIRYGFGIPRRVFRRLPTSYALVGSREVAVPKDKEERYMDVDIPGFPMPPYDYLVGIAYESLPVDKVKLGVRMEEQEGQVVVKEVVAGSSADQAGVQAGDVIVAIDQEPVSENFDLIYAVGQKAKGDKGTLEVERAGTRLTLEVEFQPLPASGAHK